MLEIYRERVPGATEGYVRLKHDVRAQLAQTMQSPPLAASAWQKGDVRVISAVEIAEYPDKSGENGPQWHISITLKGVQRASDRQVHAVLKAFRMPRTEEDNHHPGAARHYWCSINPAHRVDCECKVDEAMVREPDGYTWSNDVDVTKCRGCEWQRLFGKPCPVHSAAAGAAR